MTVRETKYHDIEQEEKTRKKNKNMRKHFKSKKFKNKEFLLLNIYFSCCNLKQY